MSLPQDRINKLNEVFPVYSPMYMLIDFYNEVRQS